VRSAAYVWAGLVVVNLGLLVSAVFSGSWLAAVAYLSASVSCAGASYACQSAIMWRSIAEDHER
jgi:hypothetical protein